MKADHVDYSGERFNSWTVIRFGEFRYKNRCKLWLCRCDCGIEKLQAINVLKEGKSKSCGHAPALIHGMVRHKKPTPEYKAWINLKQRCSNSNERCYASYGGRGIQVCEFIWNNPTSLLRLIGTRPQDGLSVDRKCNDGHYSCGGCQQCRLNGWPLNLQWSTKIQQSRNRRNSVLAVVGAVAKSVPELARESGLHASSIHKRIKNGKRGAELLLSRQYKGGRPRVRL